MPAKRPISEKNLPEPMPTKAEQLARQPWAEGQRLTAARLTATAEYHEDNLGILFMR
jgi:hypothetical protein